MFSEGLINKMGLLTNRQRRAIPRVVRALSDGHTMESLLKGEGKVCAWSTWYRKGRGWSHQELFMEVLEEARAEYDQRLLDRAVDDAAETLRRTTPLAANMARGIILGVLMGEEVEGVPPVLRDLYEIASGRPVRTVETVEGVEVEVTLPASVSDRRQAARDLLTLGQRAAADLLDRADVKTAIKQVGGEGAEWRGLMEQLHTMGPGDARRGFEDDTLADV